jgi:hypothetical protein
MIYQQSEYQGLHMWKPVSTKEQEKEMLLLFIVTGCVVLHTMQ